MRGVVFFGNQCRNGMPPMPFAPHALVREKTEARAARLENAGDLVNHNIKIGDVLKNLIVDDQIEAASHEGRSIAVHPEVRTLKAVRSARFVAAN